MARVPFHLAEFERSLATLLRAHRPEGAVDREWDLELPDGLAIQLKRPSSTRDRHAAFLSLAYAAGVQEDGRRVVLVALLPRMSARRAHEEWQRFTQLMPPRVRRRIGFVALASDRDEALPDDDAVLRRLTAVAREALKSPGAELVDPEFIGPWSPKQFDVWRVLLAAWLRSEPPLQIRELQQRTGTHYSTVASTIARLERSGEIERSSNRSVRLAKLPHASLSELVSVGEPFRRTKRYVDGSGRAADPIAFVKRLEALAPAGVALGGVVAARHYVPDFDLNGLPRVDVTAVGAGLDWVTATNAALQRAPEQAAALLVVHRVDRPDPLFEPAARGGLPFADPAEVLLDLYELRLPAQAEDFVRTMRRKKASRE